MLAIFQFSEFIAEFSIGCTEVVEERGEGGSPDGSTTPNILFRWIELLEVLTG